MKHHLATTQRISGAMAAVCFITAAASILVATAASAPEPANLNGALSGNNTSANATYVNSQTVTTAYAWPGTWAAGNLPAGAPCATYYATAGTVLYTTIHRQGSYVRCQ